LTSFGIVLSFCYSASVPPQIDISGLDISVPYIVYPAISPAILENAIMLCSFCQEIFKELVVWRQTSRERNYAKIRLRDFRHSNHHSSSLESVRVNARNGCQICSMLCLQFEVVGEFDSNAPKEDLNLEYTFTEPGLSTEHLNFRYDGKRCYGLKYLTIVPEKG
jgi:hypothetical protein